MTLALFSIVLSSINIEVARAQRICNVSGEGLMSCRPSITPPYPTAPTSQCCNTMTHANISCLFLCRSFIICKFTCWLYTRIIGLSVLKFIDFLFPCLVTVILIHRIKHQICVTTSQNYISSILYQVSQRGESLLSSCLLTFLLIPKQKVQTSCLPRFLFCVM